MSAGPFPQANIVHSLCIALAKLSDAPELSARILAEAVAPKYPSVPLPAIKVLAAKVLHLHFEPVEIADIESAGLDTATVAAVCEFLGAALQAEANGLRHELRKRRDRVARIVK